MDPDDVYDPDEYEYGFAAEHSAPRPPAAAVAAAASAAVQPLAAAVAASLGGARDGPQADDDGAEEAAAGGEAAQQRPRRRRHPRDDLSRGVRMLLLVGPSLHRLACRLSTAVAATCKVTWQLGGEALQGLRHSLDRTRQEAAQGFAERCARGRQIVAVHAHGGPAAYQAACAAPGEYSTAKSGQLHALLLAPDQALIVLCATCCHPRPCCAAALRARRCRRGASGWRRRSMTCQRCFEPGCPPRAGLAAAASPCLHAILGARWLRHNTTAWHPYTRQCGSATSTPFALPCHRTCGAR